MGILRSVVGGVERGRIRGRISTFMVGDPGTAKSTLAREAVDLKPNSRYVTGPHSSAKTITAIMDKDNDGLVLRLGAIAQFQRKNYSSRNLYFTYVIHAVRNLMYILPSIHLKEKGITLK